MKPRPIGVALVGVVAFSMRPAVAQAQAEDRFADRPIAWDEHDDGDVARPPQESRVQEWDVTLLLRDSLAGEVERVLSLEGAVPAEDVNAFDEVPCSTWFCPRNHLLPMTPAAVAAGPPAQPPQPPLRILRGKEVGATPGFRVIDARGHRFLLKIDPAGYLGMATGAEMVGERFFHAAGYNVPGAFLLDVDPRELIIDPAATFLHYGVEKQPLTAEHARAVLAGAARLPDGRLRVVLVPWIEGRILGGFDMIGRRRDDPNDRIAHERRRSLRASWVLFAWLDEMDPSSLNSLDSYVAEGGRHFVRHYVIDFGSTLGSGTKVPKGLHEGSEYKIEVGRTLAAVAGVGLYRRAFHDQRAEWDEMVARHPSVGWFPAEGFDPDAFRTTRKSPAHVRKTDRDLYWGAKLVTSFTDAQIAAVVATAGLPEPEAVAYVVHALVARRDIIGRRYLTAIAAVENPWLSAGAVCFDDLAIARGYQEAARVRYRVEITGSHGLLSAAEQAAAGARTCVPGGAALAPPPFGDDGYRVVRVVASYAGASAPSKAARIHLRWRAGEARFVTVGLERDE